MKRTLSTSALFLALMTSSALSQPQPPSQLRLCTGPDQGNYDFSGVQIKRQALNVVNISLVQTKGSMENLDKIASGDCDAAIVQSDAYGVYMKQHAGAVLNVERGRVLYPEYVHLVCNKSAGLSKITKLKKGMTVLVGPNGGGSSVTWDSFVIADPNRYGPISTAPIGGKRGLGMVDDGTEATCLLYVSGLESQTMKDADDYAEKTGHLVLVPTDDSDVEKLKDNKGRPIYEDTSIPSGTYPRSFQTRSLTGSSIGAIAPNAIVIANVTFIEAKEAIYDKFLTAVNKALPTIKEHISGGRK